MAKYTVEVQDSNGNIYNPHTSASVVFGADGKPISTIATLTHTRTATTHTLVGTMPTTGLVSATFKATADFTENNTFSINGTAYTAKPNGEELTLPDKAFVLGDVVSVAVDVAGKKINFRVGGGGTKVPGIFGDGSDGDLIIKAGQTVTLPVEHPHKDIIIKQYKSILIETNGKLTTAAPNCGFVIKCKGDCTIDGTIDQSGKGGFTNDSLTYEFPPVMCGKGGNGGNGGTALSSSTIGVGSVGGVARVYGGGLSGQGGSGAGATCAGVTGDSTLQSQRGGNKGGVQNNTANLPTNSGGQGAMKGSSSTGQAFCEGGYGGDASAVTTYGGGLVALYCGSNLKIKGTISCNGTDGGNGSDGGSGTGDNRRIGNGGGGAAGNGGSGGGAIYLCHNAEYLLTGTLSVNAGMGGSFGEGGYKDGLNNWSPDASAKKGTVGLAGTIGEVKVIKYVEGQTV